MANLSPDVPETFTPEDVEVIEVAAGSGGTLEIDGILFSVGQQTPPKPEGQPIIICAHGVMVRYRRLIGAESPAPAPVPKAAPVVAVADPVSLQPDDPCQQVLLAKLQAAKGRRGHILPKGGSLLYRLVKDIVFKEGQWFGCFNNGATDSAIALADIETFEEEA